MQNNNALEYYQRTASDPRTPEQITVIRQTLERHHGLAAALAFAAAAISAAAAPPAPPPNGAERNLVAAVLVLEAGGEPNAREAMAAVWETIWNRCHRRQWHSQPYKVVAQPLQFSCLNGISHAGAIARAQRHPQWRVAYGLVSAPPTSQHARGADHYHAATMRRLPYWARGRQPVARFGGHTFYRLSK